jgi:CheY-like chemotaxis protein
MISVLVVDDDPAHCAMLREVLELDGYTVSTAKHGGPALAQMRRSTVPLVVLLGLMMPVVDGEQVLEAVAADASLAARHRIIMVTGNTHRATQGRVAELRQRLDVPLVPKPFTFAQLIQPLEEVAASMSWCQASGHAFPSSLGSHMPCVTAGWSRMQKKCGIAASGRRKGGSK